MTEKTQAKTEVVVGNWTRCPMRPGGAGDAATVVWIAPDGGRIKFGWGSALKAGFRGGTTTLRRKADGSWDTSSQEAAAIARNFRLP